MEKEQKKKKEGVHESGTGIVNATQVEDESHYGEFQIKLK